MSVDATPEHPCPEHAEFAVQGTCERCGSFYCARCLSLEGRSSSSRRCGRCAAPPLVAPKIGGWLVLPAIGLGLTTIRLVRNIFADMDVLYGGMDPAFAPPVSLELLANLALLTYTIYTALAFFRRRQRAVRLMVGFYVAGLAMVVFDVAIGAWVAAIGGGENSAIGPSIVGAVIAPFVWIIYFLQSQRVKETFLVP